MPCYPDRIAAKHTLFHILNSFESFTCQENKEMGQKFANHAVINIYFINNKGMLSIDSVMKDKEKIFKKNKEKNNFK